MRRSALLAGVSLAILLLPASTRAQQQDPKSGLEEKGYALLAAFISARLGVKVNAAEVKWLAKEMGRIVRETTAEGKDSEIEMLKEGREPTREILRKYPDLAKIMILRVACRHLGREALMESIVEDISEHEGSSEWLKKRLYKMKLKEFMGRLGVFSPGEQAKLRSLLQAADRLSRVPESENMDAALEEIMREQGFLPPKKEEAADPLGAACPHPACGRSHGECKQAGVCEKYEKSLREKKSSGRWKGIRKLFSHVQKYLKKDVSFQGKKKIGKVWVNFKVKRQGERLRLEAELKRAKTDYKKNPTQDNLDKVLKLIPKIQAEKKIFERIPDGGK